MIETAPKTIKTIEFCDIQVNNSAQPSNITLQQVIVTYEQQGAAWVRTGQTFGNRVVVTDGLLLNPTTLAYWQSPVEQPEATPENPNPEPVAEPCVPALSHVQQIFAAEWTSIGGFAERFMIANGKMGQPAQ